MELKQLAGTLMVEKKCASWNNSYGEKMEKKSLEIWIYLSTSKSFSDFSHKPTSATSMTYIHIRCKVKNKIEKNFRCKVENENKKIIIESNDFFVQNMN